MSEKDRDNLLNIFDCINKIDNYKKEINSFEEFSADDKTVDAILMNLIIIGESVAKISNEFKDIYNEIDWKKIIGFRNIAVHDYFGVDLEEVWQILLKHIPELKDYLDKINNSEKITKKRK